MLRQQIATNDAAIRAHQTREGVPPIQSVSNDVAGRISTSEAQTTEKIDSGRAQLSLDAGALSENYNASVRIGKISSNHGGNQAVWDTVGANADHPELGTPATIEQIGDSPFGRNSIPVVDPKLKASPAASPSQESGTHGSGQSTTNEGTKGKR